MLSHSFPSHAPEQPNARTVSSNTTAERAASCSTLRLCLWVGPYTRGRKMFWEETVIKQPQVSKMAVLGIVALRCCFSEQSSFHKALSFV